eukprot:285886-Hanusia_phi.AAC.1
MIGRTGPLLRGPVTVIRRSDPADGSRRPRRSRRVTVRGTGVPARPGSAAARPCPPVTVSGSDSGCRRRDRYPGGGPGTTQNSPGRNSFCQVGSVTIRV